jgi:hypothetical protein
MSSLSRSEISQSNQSAAISESRAPATNVAMATNLPGTDSNMLQSEELRDAALTEAQRVLSATDNKEREADEEGWTLIELMLKLLETFINPKTNKLNQTALDAFCARHGARQHGNAKNPLQSLAKVCFPKGTRSDRSSKFGAALAAMVKRNINSAIARKALSESGPVPEENGPVRTGIIRFTLLHREDQKLEKRAGSPEQPAQNKYLKLSDESLKAEALLIIEALQAKSLLPFDPDKIVQALQN